MQIIEENGTILIKIIKPDNFHVHWRESQQFLYTMPWSAKQFEHILIMPNIAQPLIDAEAIETYGKVAESVRKKISADFLQPHFTLYLTEQTTPDNLIAAQEKGMLAAKLYPANVTTNAVRGVANVRRLWHLFAWMEEHDVPLSVHGEVVADKISVFDRERYFVENVFGDIISDFPQLRVVLEHVSTKEGVQCVWKANSNVVATITPHHLLCNCNDLLCDGISPNKFCYPILNTPHDQEALIAAAISGSPKFFLGTDSAPHPVYEKYCDGGCGGCLTEPYAMALYIEAFERAGALDKLENFASVFGADFYKLEKRKSTICFVRKPQKIAKRIKIGIGIYGVPFMAEEMLQWSQA